MTQQTKEKAFDNTGINIYGKGDSVIAFAPLKHERENEQTKEKKLKGYKLKVTVTIDNFKTKDYIYLEQEELLDFILVLKGKISEMKGVRNGETSNANKSFKLSKMPSGDLICSFDIEKKDRMNFKITTLNQIVLLRILKKQLIKDIKRKTEVAFTEIELDYYIKDILSERNVIEQKSNTSNNSNSNTKSYSSNNKSSSTGFQLKFINTYNGKDYDNHLDVDEIIYKYIKKLDCSKQDDKSLKNLLSKIKGKTNKDQNKFLTIENIKTLSVV